MSSLIRADPVFSGFMKNVETLFHPLALTRPPHWCWTISVPTFRIPARLAFWCAITNRRSSTRPPRYLHPVWYHMLRPSSSESYLLRCFLSYDRQLYLLRLNFPKTSSPDRFSIRLSSHMSPPVSFLSVSLEPGPINFPRRLYHTYTTPIRWPNQYKAMRKTAADMTVVTFG